MSTTKRDEIDASEISYSDQVLEALGNPFGEKNPFEISLEETFSRLQTANMKEGWGIGEEVFDRLAKTAPEWPKGYDSFRSLRIRFGTGDEGVCETFEAHLKRIQSTFGGLYLRFDFMQSDREHLRLLNGNDSHKPCVEWFTTDLSANRYHKKCTDRRGPMSLAEEGLTIAWMFPERVETIDSIWHSAWFLAGYELNRPEEGQEWDYVPIVFQIPLGPMCIFPYKLRLSDYATISVPEARES